jgi:hypothetical protein
MSDYLSAIKQKCLSWAFLTQIILGYFWEGSRPRGFCASGLGRIGPLTLNFLLSLLRGAFRETMSGVLGYLEGGREMFPILALTNN